MIKQEHQSTSRVACFACVDGLLHIGEHALARPVSLGAGLEQGIVQHARRGRGSTHSHKARHHDAGAMRLGLLGRPAIRSLPAAVLSLVAVHTALVVGDKHARPRQQVRLSSAPRLRIPLGQRFVRGPTALTGAAARFLGRVAHPLSAAWAAADLLGAQLRLGDSDTCARVIERERR